MDRQMEGIAASGADETTTDKAAETVLDLVVDAIWNFENAINYRENARQQKGDTTAFREADEKVKEARVHLVELISDIINLTDEQIDLHRNGEVKMTVDCAGCDPAPSSANPL